MIEKLSKFWAGAIAYVALLAGAGLSVAGNVADTYRTRAGATDALDVILAGAWPVLVLLTIELFVSRRWSPERGFQILRWLGCLAIGSMAMMVSWVHLHDLLSSRGQILPVATGGPLAIDGMAIMATGLLLSTRGLARMATMAMPVTSTWTGPVATEADVAESEAAFRGDVSIADEASSYLDRLATEFGDVASVLPVPVSGPPALARSNEVKPESIPEDTAGLIRAWVDTHPMQRPTLKDASVILAAHIGRSPRTARRWIDAMR